MADSVEEEIQELSALYWSERDPEGRAFAPLADAYRRQGDHWRALELLREGLGRHGDFTPGLIVSAWVRRDLGEVDAAHEAFDAALALDGENTEALRGLGEIAADRGDPATATHHYQKLNEMEPGDLEIVARLREIERAGRQAPSPVAPPPQPPPEPVREAVPETVLEAEPEAVLEAVPEAALEAEPEAVLEPMAEPMAEPVLVAPPDADSSGTPSFEGLELEALEPEPEPDAFSATAHAADATEPVEGGDDGPITRTMADLYAKQGLHDRALRIYRRLLENDPWDDEVKVRMAALEKLVGAPAPTAKRPASPGFARGVADTETLAQDWSEGPRETGPIETPFAWTAPPAEPGSPAQPGEAPPSARPVSDYFRGLLEWEPAQAEPGEVAPKAEPEAALAAGAERVAEAAGPQADPVVERTAFVEPAVVEPAAVPIETLAPGRVVPIESLAPDGIVPIESLAPVIVDIASLAP